MTTINKFSSYCLKDLVKERREPNTSVLEVVFHFNTTLMLIWRKKRKQGKNQPDEANIPLPFKLRSSEMEG